MRTPEIGDEFVSAQRPGTLGRVVTWRVTRLARKADKLDYVELHATNAQLPTKLLSVRALSDPRLFARHAGS